MPNITTVNDLQGKTEIGSVVYGTTTSSQGSVSNEQDFLHNATSSQTFKLNTLMVANAGSSAVVASVSFYDGNAATIFVDSLTIPGGSTLEVLASPIYVNNGEYITVGLETASSTIRALASYELLQTTS
jgi:hypothetical protein